MKPLSKRWQSVLYWAPRGLAMLFAAFISLFALDVFAEGYSFGETIVALLMHLVPTGLVLFALALAWRWEWLGGVFFVGLAIFYLVLAWGKFDWTTYLIISGPLFLIGALFWGNWLYRRKVETATESRTS
ncbi:MAG: hypothetical protein U9R25_16935 [Chloroflexota bacterium]|nr:hypothetical protein [Chloroflexota bacterium]